MSKSITTQSIILSQFTGLFLFATVSLASPENGMQLMTYNGPSIGIGGGNAHSFLTLGVDGKPYMIGIKFSDTVLNGLPAEPPPGEEGWEYRLQLPAEAKGTGYDHVVIDWNPHGHSPEGIYNTPHFDFHFYLINDESRNLITAVNEDLERTNKQPVSKYMPAGYVLPPGTEVPRMGAHAINPSAEEFNGKPFMKTFIYGFYDGRMVFLEPMISEAYFKTEPDFSAMVAVPEEYALHAYYPNRYGVKYDRVKKEYIISLENLVPR